MSKDSDSKTVTHVLMVIDESGSMHRLARDVAGGFNSYIDSLRIDEGSGKVKYRITVTLFNTEVRRLVNDHAVSRTPRLTEDTYTPNGMTALHDAIAQTIVDFEKAHPKLKKNERVLMVISTDGQENSSHEYTLTEVRAMIEERTKQGWGFIYLGANLEAFEQGFAYGLGSTTVLSGATGQSARASYDGLYVGTRSFAGGGSAAGTAAQVATVVAGAGTYQPTNSGLEPDPSTTVDTDQGADAEPKNAQKLG